MTITKTLRKEIGETQLFKLMIFPLTEKSVKQLDYFKGEWFGSIHNQENMETEYNVYHSPFGIFVGYHRKVFHDKINFPIIKPVYLSKIPNDIDQEKIFVKKIN